MAINVTCLHNEVHKKDMHEPTFSRSKAVVRLDIFQCVKKSKPIELQENLTSHYTVACIPITRIDRYSNVPSDCTNLLIEKNMHRKKNS